MIRRTKKPPKANPLRKRIKFPGLNKKFTTALRQDYFEGDYIDGVRNENDELVIRPLTEEEKQWLNDFNEEEVNIRVCESDNPRFIKTQTERREAWHTNNVRNRCLFNRKKTAGGLDNFPEERTYFLEKHIGHSAYSTEDILILYENCFEEEEIKPKKKSERNS